MLAPLRLPDFRLLWGGQLLSSCGTWLLLVAVPYEVFQLTGSPAATGFTFVAETVPALALGPVAGVLVDRWDRRRTMIAVDLARAAAVLPLLAAHTPDRVWIVYAALLVESVLGQLFDPAAQALVPAMVGRGPHLASANALLSLVAAGSRIVGAPLGGIVLAATGLAPLVVADAGTYVASAASLLLIRHRTSPVREISRQAPLRTAAADLAEGVCHVIRTRIPRALLVVGVTFLAADGAFTALLVPYIHDRLHGAAGDLGLIFAATGLGFLAGAPLSRILTHRIGQRATMAASLAVAGAGFIAWFDAGRLEIALAMAVLSGAAVIVFYVGRRTLLQTSTPDAVLGRTAATVLAAEAAAMLGGTALGGVVAGAIGLTWTAHLAGAAILLSGVLAAALIRPGHARQDAGRR